MKNHLIPFKLMAHKLCRKFEDSTFEHIPRELNQYADRLSNAALDDENSRIYPVPQYFNN